MHVITQALVALSPLLVSVPGAVGDPVLDQHNTPPETIMAGLTVASDRTQIQTFTVGVSGTLTWIDLQVGRNLQTAEDLVVSVWSTDAVGLPDAPLATATVTADDPAFGVPVPPEDVPPVRPTIRFDLAPAALQVAAGDRLAIELNSTTPNDPLTRYSWGMGGQYEAGEASTRTSTGSPRELQPADFRFATYISPAGAGPSPVVQDRHGTVSIRLPDTGGVFTITSLDGTLVWIHRNGGQTTQGPLPTIGRNLTIRGGSGDDELHLADLTVPGDLTIDTGSGADQVNVGNLPLIHPWDPEHPVSVGGDLTLRTDGGDDAIWTSALTVTGATSIATGAGKATITLGGRGNPQLDGQVPSYFDGGLTIRTGAADDSITLYAVRATGGARIVTGAGADRVGLGSPAGPVRFREMSVTGGLLVDTGAGIDQVNGTGLRADATTIDLGAGDNSLNIGFLTGADSIDVTAGRDNDAIVVRRELPVSEVQVDEVVIRPGAGDDRVGVLSFDTALNLFLGHGDDVATVTSARTTYLGVFGSSGNDQVTLDGVTSTGAADLWGGPGAADVLTAATSTFTRSPGVRGFEQTALPVAATQP